MAAVCRLRHERYAGNIGKSIPVAEGDGPALLDPQIEDSELPSADTRQDITHPVVVPNFGMLISDPWIASLRRPESGFFDDAAPPRHEHPAAGSGDNLVAVEREYGEVAEGARGP